MKVLGIESSCDETAAAIVNDKKEILGECVLTQLEHKIYGGVVPENVSVEDGKLKLEGHGNLYDGDIEGVNHDLPGGIRTGAAIATREYYASGSYEVVAKIAPVLGACSAMWTFEYEEYEQGTPEYEASGATCQNYIVNHEIDIEIPGRPSSNASPSFAYALCNSYTNENRVTTNYTKLPYAVDDGAFHTYRFDWHTGDTDEQPRVDYYIDGHLICVCTTNIPTNARTGAINKTMLMTRSNPSYTVNILGIYVSERKTMIPASTRATMPAI